MVDEKKGVQISKLTYVLMWILVVVGFLAVFSSYFSFTTGSIFQGLPDSMVNIWIKIGNVLGPFAKGIYFAVAPAGEPENVQAIAFAIFLLLFLVGIETLGQFFRNGIITFIVSAIVGVIASRSLTASVLADSAIGASPIATASLLLGFLPILALSRSIDRWGINQWGKLVVFTVAGGVYFLIFSIAFDATELGATYAIGIVALGFAQSVLAFWGTAVEDRKNKGLGRFMASNERTIHIIETMAKGYNQAGAGR